MIRDRLRERPIARKTGARRDHCHDLFATDLVARREHRHLAHRGVCEQHAFHLDAGDVLARAADDVLLAVEKEQAALGVLHHDVAGMQPAAAPRLPGRGLVLEVPREEAAPRIWTFRAYQELAWLAARHVMATFVGDAHLERWPGTIGLADASFADVARLHQRGHQPGAAGLGHRPAFDERHAEACLEGRVVRRVNATSHAEAHAMRAVVL